MLAKEKTIHETMNKIVQRIKNAGWLKDVGYEVQFRENPFGNIWRVRVSAPVDGQLVDAQLDIFGNGRLHLRNAYHTSTIIFSKKHAKLIAEALATLLITRYFELAIERLSVENSAKSRLLKFSDNYTYCEFSVKIAEQFRLKACARIEKQTKNLEISLSLRKDHRKTEELANGSLSDVLPAFKAFLLQLTL